MFVDERVMPWLRAAGLGDFAALFGYQAGEEMAKPGLSSYRRRTRLELSNGQGEVRAFYLKRYQRPPLREQLRRMREHGFKSSCGRRELHFVKVLSRLGVPTLRGVGFGEKMFGPLERRSFGLTAEVGGESLETLAERAGVDPGEIPPWTQRREIIRQLALLVGHLHGNRLFHRDLYLCHVFLTRNVDGRIVLRLIDLARMLENPRRGGRWRIKDLAGLDYSAPAGLVTRADRLRFLYDYQAGGWPRVDGASGRDPEMKHCLRETIRRVRARGRRMARHDGRRARRLEGKGEA
jgi:heptose I phosphotransferase